MGTPLGPKYIPYTYMDPLGWRPERNQLDLREVHQDKAGEKSAKSAKKAGKKFTKKRAWRSCRFQTSHFVGIYPKS